VLSLDVGCGSRPKGDVNVDLLSERFGVKENFFIKPQRISNFVLADACHLPFKDGSFENVFSSAVIEHVINPIEMLNELIRVSSLNVVVKCPHRFNETPTCRHSKHRSFFSRVWFVRFLRRHVKVQGFYTEISRYRPFPHQFFSLVSLPREITVEIFVKKVDVDQRKCGV